MGRVLLVLIALVGFGCSSGPPPEPPRPLVLALLPAPELGALEGDPGGEEPGLVGGDFLLEVATQLSAEARLDLCFVPGPILRKGLEEESLEDALIAVSDGLGQIAASVSLGLTAEDEAEPRLLEALKEAVRDHPGEASVWGKAVLGWRPVSLSASQTLSEVEEVARAEARRAAEAEDEEEDSEEAEARQVEVATPLLIVLGDAAAATVDPRVRLRVVRGELPEVVEVGKVLEVRLPPIQSGLYALAVLHSDRLELEWRSVEPERVDAPAPVSIPWPGQAKRTP